MAYGGCGVVVNRKVELRRKPCAAQQTQGVFPKRVGRSHTHNAAPQVLHAAAGVEYETPIVGARCGFDRKRHSVDGEVAAAQILLYAVRRRCQIYVRRAAFGRQDNARNLPIVVKAQTAAAERIRKIAPDGKRVGLRHNINIVRAMPNQRIANCAADEICAYALCPKEVGNRLHQRGQRLGIGQAGRNGSVVHRRGFAAV